MPLAKRDIEAVGSFFRREYNVGDEDITVLRNATYEECAQAYTALSQELDDPRKKTVVIHVLAGHGVQLNGEVALLLNEHDVGLNFHKRFPVEELIRQIAEMRHNSYHVAVFACSRETEKKRYQLLSIAHASETIQGQVTGPSREELKLADTHRSEESKLSIR